MTGSETRVVQPADGGIGAWVVRDGPGGPVRASARTQQLAITAARDDLLSNGGGRIVVMGRDGTERRRIPVRPARVVEPAPDADPLAPQEVGDAIGAAVARARGESFDRDDDGEADGDDVLNRVVDLGPDGEARDAIRQAKQWLQWLAAATAAFPIVPSWVISSELGGGFVGIFLGTLAWSLGVAIIAYAVIAHPGVGSTTGLTLLGFGAFWFSNLVAGALGGTVLTAAEPVPEYFSPPGVASWIGDILGAAAVNYGVLGVAIATVLGALVGWRAAELRKLLST